MLESLIHIVYHITIYGFMLCWILCRADIKQYIGFPSPSAVYKIYESCISELMRVRHRVCVYLITHAHMLHVQVGIISPQQLLTQIKFIQRLKEIAR